MPIKKLLCATTICVLLSACSSTPSNNTPSVRVPVQKAQTNRELQGSSIQTLLSRAETNNPSRATYLRLEAATFALAKENLDQTKQILTLINNPTERKSALRFAILHVELAIAEKDASTALKWLSHSGITSANLSRKMQIEIGTLRSKAYYLNRSYLASARERIFFDSLLPRPQKLDNHEVIFTTLMELSVSTLTRHAQKAITSELRGWLSLAAMSKQNQRNALNQLQELEKWKRVWSSHPASFDLPKSLAALDKVVEDQPKSIALFLPLQGNLGIYGRAIRNGIIAANYDSPTTTKIKVYDTSKANMSNLLHRAVSEGAEMIIGPLDRENVTSLVSEPTLPLPVLALNRSHIPNTHPNFYQFGLAPDDEVLQVANQVFKEGKRNVLVIYPDSDWGERNFKTFNQKWHEQGGNVISSTMYKNQKDYSALIKSLLYVDKSEVRAKELRRITGKRFEFTPRRRQDIDFVFLLGNQSQAMGIKPMLDFYYAEDIPVYSTSHINERSDSKIESLDLDGIRFCDIPWKIGQSDSLQQAVEASWSNSKTNMSAFYALGIDAYRLYPRLQQLKNVATSKVYGSTGILSLDKENILRRKLLWAQFSKGEVVSSPIVLNPS